jgi:hypothetical protein
MKKKKKKRSRKISHLSGHEALLDANQINFYYFIVEYKVKIFVSLFLFNHIYIFGLTENTNKGGEGSEWERDQCIGTAHTERADTFHAIFLQYPV